jgi:hypothetical protein
MVREKPAAQPDAAVEPALGEQQSRTDTTRQPEQLPETAGELPLLGLIGILCLGVGLGLKVLSARS